MADITANRTLRDLSAVESMAGVVKVSSETRIYLGSLLEYDTDDGFVKPLGTATNGVFVGVASEEKLIAADTETRIAISVAGGIAKSSDGAGSNLSRLPIAGVSSATDIGSPVYCATTNIRDATLTSTSAVKIGYVAGFEAAGFGHIKLLSLEEMFREYQGEVSRYETRSFVIDCADIANGDLITDVPLQGIGEIVAVRAIVSKVTTDTDADATIAVHIDATPTTGGVITIADANGAAGAALDTLGEAIAGTAITGANTFNSANTLSIVASGVTAFSDGRIQIEVDIKRAA